MTARLRIRSSNRAIHLLLARSLGQSGWAYYAEGGLAPFATGGHRRSDSTNPRQLPPARSLVDANATRTRDQRPWDLVRGRR